MKSYISIADWEFLDLESLVALLEKVQARDLPDEYLYVAKLQDYIATLSFEKYGDES
jgi:hypothetical protein